MDTKQYVADATKTESVPAVINLGPQATFATLNFCIQASELMDQMKRQIFYGKSVDSEKLRALADDIAGTAHFLATQAEEAALLDQDDLLKRLEAQGIEEESGAKLHKHFTECRDALNVRLLHAGLGLFTESGEILEAVRKGGLFRDLDKTNVGEEFGDILWYVAIGSSETGVPLERVMDTNIAKLSKRYPEKFDATRAVERDLATERATLEAGLQKEAA